MAELPIVDDPLGMDADAVGKLLGVPADVMRSYLELQPAIGKLRATLDAGTPAFGGLFVEYKPTYVIAILASVGSRDLVVDAIDSAGFPELSPFIDVRETSLTEDNLNLARQEARELVPGLIRSSDIDLVGGKVLLWVATSADAEELRQSLDSAALAIPSPNFAVEVGLFEDEVDSYGGLNLNSPAGNCTSGFSVSQTGGGSDGITDAAHCANSNVSLNGNFPVTFVAGKWNGDQDVQWFTTPGLNDVSKINDGSGTRAITSRTGRSEMYVTEAVCHFGRSGGYGCGIIAGLNYNPEEIDDHNYNDTFIRVGGTVTQGGDSGGPWFMGNSAFGIHKGHAPNTDLVFMAQNFMSVLGIVVKIH